MHMITKQTGLMMKTKIIFLSFSSHPQCHTPEANSFSCFVFSFGGCLLNSRYDFISVLIYPL